MRQVNKLKILLNKMKGSALTNFTFSWSFTFLTLLVWNLFDIYQYLSSEIVYNKNKLK